MHNMRQRVRGIGDRDRQLATDKRTLMYFACGFTIKTRAAKMPLIQVRYRQSVVMPVVVVVAAFVFCCNCFSAY